MNRREVEYENLKKVNAFFQNEIESAIQEVANSGWYILGEQLRKFEQKFAEAHQVPYCVGVANGLDALILSLEVLELPKGSEVILPSNTFIATVLAVVRAGLTPVLVEPDLATYQINSDLIESHITSATKVIMPVHLYGNMCNMEAILAIAQKHSLHVIEDCAQSHFSEFKGKRAGTFGDLGAFSFYPTKNLGALGDAGAIITQDSNLYDKLKYWRNYGSGQKYYNKFQGYNSRLDEIQAAVLSAKLPYLEKMNAHKNELASIYFTQLDPMKFVLPVPQKDYYNTFHIFPIRHPRRNELKDYLVQNGIKTEIHYPLPPHLQEGYQALFAGKTYPLSELIHSTILSLPISLATSEEDVRYICRVMNTFE